MSIRKLLSVAATGSAIAVAVVVPALPGAAAPSGGCPYPPNRPVLTLTASPAVVVSGHKVAAFGKFSQNNCGIKNASILLQRRALVSGKPSGKWATLKTLTTNTNGVWSAARYPRVNEQLRALFNKAGSYPTTTSTVRSLLVRTRVTFNYSLLANCRIHMAGSTSPVKAGKVIAIEARDPKGQFTGWQKLASTTTNSKGVYSFSKTALCGTTYNLRALIGADKFNGYGGSRTIFGIKPHK